eukprot:Pgem_evm1s19201
MGRDRLSEMQNINPDARTGPDLGAIDMEDTQHVEQFLNELDEVRQNVDKIKDDTEKISEKHSQKLSAVSESQGNKNNQELDNLNSDLNATANKVRNKLKKM